MKIGILGGTFDPPHFAHLKIAQLALRKFGLNRVIFMLSAKQPIKIGKRKMAPVNHRLEMLKLLIQGYPQFEIFDLELKRAKRGQKSYTIDTIYALKKLYPGDKIYWILGADSFQELIEGKWKDGGKVLKLVDLIVASRPGYLVKIPKNIKIKRLKINCNISSTEIRERFKRGKNAAVLLPQKVLNYIKKNKLYIKIK